MSLSINAIPKLLHWTWFSLLLAYWFWWNNLYRPCAHNEIDGKAQVRNIAATSRIVRSNGCTSRLGLEAWVYLWQQRLKKGMTGFCYFLLPGQAAIKAPRKFHLCSDSRRRWHSAHLDKTSMERAKGIPPELLTEMSISLCPGEWVSPGEVRHKQHNSNIQKTTQSGKGIDHSCLAVTMPWFSKYWDRSSNVHVFKLLMLNSKQEIAKAIQLQWTSMCLAYFGTVASELLSPISHIANNLWDDELLMHCGKALPKTAFCNMLL